MPHFSKCFGMKFVSMGQEFPCYSEILHVINIWRLSLLKICWHGYSSPSASGCEVGWGSSGSPQPSYHLSAHQSLTMASSNISALSTFHFCPFLFKSFSDWIAPCAWRAKTCPLHCFISKRIFERFCPGLHSAKVFPHVRN